MGEHLDRRFARDAAFLGQQHAFGEGQHLDGQTKVHRNLHGKRQAVVANVRDFGTNVEQ